MSNIKTRYFLVINNSQKYYSTKKKYLFLNYPIIEKLRNNNSNKYKKEEIYILLFDLYRVLLINKKWLTEGEFYDSESLYKNSYRNYQLQIFKNFMRS